MEYDYWWSEYTVRQIARKYNTSTRELLTHISPVKIAALLDNPPAWKHQRNLGTMQFFCAVCDGEYEVENRTAFIERRESCDKCGHRGFAPEERQKWVKRPPPEPEPETERSCSVCGTTSGVPEAPVINSGKVCHKCFIASFHEFERLGWPGSVPKTKAVFDSAPEKYAYNVIRNEYPNLLVIPNAAFLAFIDLEQIKPELTTQEVDYLFKGRLDILIVETGDFMPLLALEFDSSWHDDPRVQKNDAKKERILSAAGVPLERFRINGINTFVEIESRLRELFGKAVR
jgi:hypothetical protein